MQVMPANANSQTDSVSVRAAWLSMALEDLFQQFLGDLDLPVLFMALQEASMVHMVLPIDLLSVDLLGHTLAILMVR